MKEHQMKRLRSCILFVAGAAVLVTCFGILGAIGKANQTNSSTREAAQDVRVVNKPSESIPVTPQGTTTVAGNVNVANLPATFLQTNTRYSLTIMEGSNTAQVVCIVQETRGCC